MNTYDRRRFLTGTVGAGAAAAAASWFPPGAIAAGRAKGRIKVGQIGIGHNHASAKMATFRKLADHYEVVGIVEPSSEWRRKRGNHPAYRGLTWMTEEQLLNTKGLTAVAVETDVCDLVPTAARCIDAGMHLHLDKPGGESSESKLLRSHRVGWYRGGRGPDNTVYFQVVLRDYLRHRDEASLFQAGDLLEKIKRLPTALP